MARIALLTLGILLAALTRAAVAQTPDWSVRPSVGENGEATVSQVDHDEPDDQPPGAPPHRREFVVAPLPIINPTLENGAALVLGALYTIGSGQRRSPPSASFILGMATSNHSWALGMAQTLHLDADRYRGLFAAGYLDLNFDYFGIGSDAGDAGQSILVNQAGAAGMAELLVRVAGPLYAGARYRLMRSTVGADLSDLPIAIPPADAELRTALLGPRLQLDTRDSEFYPTRGWLVDLTALFAGEDVGGRRSYQYYQAAAAKYTGIGTRQVVAARVNSCYAEGPVPFYDLCLIGQYQDLRGYPSGQYRDRAMVTGQAEYRLRFWKRFGVVAFAGAGEIAPAFGELTADELLPSAGTGLRFKLTRETRLNLRVDYAWGRNSSALYVSVGEAF